MNKSVQVPATKSRGSTAIEIVKLVTPFAFGAITLWYFLDRIDSGQRFDLRMLFAGVAPAYKLATVAYAIFAASVVIVITGTTIYLLDIYRFSKDVKGNGEGFVTAAFILAIVTVILLFFGLFYWMAYSDIYPSDICSGFDVMKNFHGHDVFIFRIFLAFLVLDILTSIGLWKAIRACTDDKDRRERLCDAQQWAWAQLSLIDIPVLVGTIVLYYTMPALAEGHWRVLDHGLVSDPAAGSEYPVGASRITNLECISGAPFPLHEFVGNMYVAGVGTGALAAQIFLSQMVFVMLGLFFRLRRMNDAAQVAAAQA